MTQQEINEATNAGKVLRLESQIMGVTYRYINGEETDEIEYENVFAGDAEVYRAARGGNHLFEEHNLPGTLLVRIDRFHDSGTIAKELARLQDDGLTIANRARTIFKENGNGVSPGSLEGNHTMCTSYLLVDSDNPTEWLGYAYIERELVCFDGTITYNINDVVIWAKVGSNRRHMYGLVGASVGYLLGSEVYWLARELVVEDGEGRYTPTGKMCMDMCVEDVVGENEEYGIMRLKEELLFMGANESSERWGVRFPECCPVEVGDFVIEY